MAKGKVTSRKAASNASKTLRSRSTSAKSKKAAGSALSQTKAPQKTTSRSAATAASKVVHDKRTSKSSKSAAASALSQTQSKGAQSSTRSSGTSRETIKCSEVMTKDPVCCSPDDTVQRAAQLMKSEDVGPIPVVSDQQTKKLIGIITDRDLAVKVVAEARDAGSTRVEEVMTTGVKACRPDDDVRKSLNAMTEYQVRRIPVIDDDDRIIGIIAQADVATRIEEPKKTAGVVEGISKSRAAGR